MSVFFRCNLFVWYFIWFWINIMTHAQWCVAVDEVDAKVGQCCFFELAHRMIRWLNEIWFRKNKLNAKLYDFEFSNARIHNTNWIIWKKATKKKNESDLIGKLLFSYFGGIGRGRDNHWGRDLNCFATGDNLSLEIWMLNSLIPDRWKSIRWFEFKWDSVVAVNRYTEL